MKKFLNKCLKLQRKDKVASALVGFVAGVFATLLVLGPVMYILAQFADVFLKLD